jgi:hypothetical protein
MTVTLDPQFAAALRRELVARVRPPAAVPWWRRRRTVLTAVGTVVALGLAGGGAVAANRSVTPGAYDIAPVAAPVTATLTGTQTVDLGPRPAGADAVDIAITCLAGVPGQVWVIPDVASADCPGPDTGSQFDLAPGQTTWTFTAAAGVHYQVSVTYLDARQTEWGVNADGYTYGTERAPSVGGFGPRTADTVPDLMAVIASNGRSGYAWSKDLDGPSPSSAGEAARWSETHPCQPRSVPVYESDGKTQIGVFEMGC